MGLRVKTNIDSLVAQRQLGETRRSLADEIEKLSSGKRINKSADDAAGLAVSEAIRARVSSLGVAKRNASDGISYVQVAEGGLNEVSNIVVRMRELVSQAASDTIGNRERSFLDKEFTQLRDEVARIVDSTEFNGSKLLKTEDNSEPIQMFVGASFRGTKPGSDEPVSYDEGEVDPDILTIDVSNLAVLEKALGAIGGPDFRILPEDFDGSNDISAPTLGPDGDTSSLLGNLDDALTAVAEYRSTLGSVQSRLNSTITNIEISNENLQAAMSRIRDVDYASEMAKFTQTQILSAAGVSVLTQANQVPQSVLTLLH